MDSSAAFPQLPGPRVGVLGAGSGAPQPPPGAGSAKGPASGTGSCDTEPPLLPHEFSYCSQAAVSVAWALPSGSAVTLTEPDPPLAPQAGWGDVGSVPIEALGSQGLWLGVGMLLQGTGAPGRGKGWEDAGHGATPGRGLESNKSTN